METSDDRRQTAFQPYQHAQFTGGSYVYVNPNPIFPEQPDRKMNVLHNIQKNSRNSRKILIFFSTVTIVVFMIASLFYLVRIKEEVSYDYAPRSFGLSPADEEFLLTETTADATVQRNLLARSDIDGWYHASNGYSYKLLYSYKTYREAKKLCAKMDSVLASTGVRNDSILREIYFHVPKQYRFTGWWVGLDKLGSLKTWRWSDGDLFNNWKADDKYDPYDLEKCATVGGYTAPNLDRAWCGAAKSYLCEKTRSQDKQ